MNVILNAKEALGNTKIESPTITVTVRDDKDNCIVTIADNAGGISIAPMDSIFDMSATTKEGSSGLGLFMTKNIIEGRFGGSIKAANKDGGAVFTIVVPLAK